MALIVKKQPAEKFVQFVDFAALLGTGELATATPITWGGYRTPMLWAGEAYEVSGDSTDIVASALHSSTGVNITLRAGTATKRYKLAVLASTSGGNVWEEDLVVEVEES